MANTYIENDLKDLIDATTWTVGSEGVTKQTYIWAESHSDNLDLNNPLRWMSTANDVVFVIHPSSRATPNKTLGSHIFSWTGRLELYTLSVANMKSAFDALKTITDAKINLDMHVGGVNGRPKQSKFWATIIYQWQKHIANS